MNNTGKPKKFVPVPNRIWNLKPYIEELTAVYCVLYLLAGPVEANEITIKRLYTIIRRPGGKRIYTKQYKAVTDAVMFLIDTGILSATGFDRDKPGAVFRYWFPEPVRNRYTLLQEADIDAVSDTLLRTDNISFDTALRVLCAARSYVSWMMNRGKELPGNIVNVTYLAKKLGISRSGATRGIRVLKYAGMVGGEESTTEQRTRAS